MQRIEVPAREGRGLRVAAGQRFAIIDVEGSQVCDLFAFSREDPSEYLSAEHTRVYNLNLFPHVGQHFVTNRRRPILLFEADATPGRHDMLVAACDPTRYQLLGVEGWHASCQENLQKAMAELGHPEIDVPQPVNLFTNIPVSADGTFEFQTALTRAGDSVTLRAEMDCYVVASACPMDRNPINAGRPKPIRVELL